MTDLYTIAERILTKMASRAHVIDWAPYSWDRRVATARAWRIVARRQGVRMTIREAM